MTIDPDAARVVALIKAAGRPPYETIGHVAGRLMYRASKAILQHDPAPVAEVIDLSATGPAGPIPLRLYRGRTAPQGRLQPCLVYFHGGGWVIGDLETHDVACRDIANAAACTVVAVDYRLAPEHPFPAAPTDAIAATEWIWENAAALGIDRNRLAVGGDSAGGNLAAVVALHARDRQGVPRLRCQVLIYPGVDMSREWPSYLEHAEQLPLTRSTMNWFLGNYLRDRNRDATDWRASPLLASSHAGLPPAYIAIAGLDPLKDEGAAYVEALTTAGVAVEVRHFPGQIHGFLTMGRMVRDAHVLTAEIGRVLVKAFA